MALNHHESQKISPLYSTAIDPKPYHTLYSVLTGETKMALLLIPLP
jgi:hypothetical protein